MNPFVYEPRKVEFHGVRNIDDHRLKIYSLFASKFGLPALPDDKKLSELLTPGLPDPKMDTDHKLGFGILHWANDGLYTLTNTWFDANMLRMKAFLIDNFEADEPDMKSLDYLNVITCVWELEIYKYERDIWVKAVLSKSPESLTPEIVDEYLTHGFRGYV